MLAPIKGVIEGIVSLVQMLFDVVTNIYHAILDIVTRLNPFDDKFILKDFLGFISVIISYLNPFDDNV